MGDPASLARAEFILEQMGALGTVAMAAGGRDLVGGVPLLKQAGVKSGVKVLSANMRGPDGAAIFPASTVAKVGGLSIGLVGLSPPGPVTTTLGVQCLDPVKAALDEAAALRPRVDVVVVLAGIEYAQAMELAKAAPGTVDFVLQSWDRRNDREARKVGSAWLVAGIDQGKALARLELTVSGKGPFADASKGKVAGPRSFRLSFTDLGADVASDPGLQGLVEKIEPRPATAP